MADKKITDLQQVSSITDSLNFPVDDTLQTYRATIGQVKTYLAPIYIPPSLQIFKSGSGTYNLGHAFIVSAANATVGATYTNNGNTYTVLMTVSSANIIWLSGNAAPTPSGSLTKASGTGDSSITFSAVRKPIYLKIKMVAGGGGGAGSGNTSTAGDGGNGTNSTFGSSLLTANGGLGGSAFTPSQGGGGGAATIGSGPIGIAIQGGSGSGVIYNGSTVAGVHGGGGASSPFGGAGGGAGVNGTAGAAIANSGSGGGGASVTDGASGKAGGAGGGAGGYIDAIILNPLLSYSYAVGSGGSAGTAGTNGNAGAAGGSGIIIVEEHYQ